jgi:hypothetical protein
MLLLSYPQNSSDWTTLLTQTHEVMQGDYQAVIAKPIIEYTIIIR